MAVSTINKVLDEGKRFGNRIEKETRRFAESQFVSELAKVATTASGFAIGGPLGAAATAGYLYKDDIADALSPDINIPEQQLPDPAATPETGGDPLDALRRSRRRTGRSATNVTGDLVPQNLGYRSLLG